MPEDAACTEKCERNFEFIHSLMKAAQKKGELDKPRFEAQEMAYRLLRAGQLFISSAIWCVKIASRMQLTAKRVVELFMAEPGPNPGGHSIIEMQPKGGK